MIRKTTRSVAAVLSLTLLLVPCGCAHMMEGTSQTITVTTSPEGKSFKFEGVRYNSPATININKKAEAAAIMVGDNHYMKIELPHEPHTKPLIWDGVLCLFFFFPGAIAFGVDFHTGAWRNYLANPVIAVPSDTPAAE